MTRAGAVRRPAVHLAREVATLLSVGQSCLPSSRPRGSRRRAAAHTWPGHTRVASCLPASSPKGVLRLTRTAHLRRMHNSAQGPRQRQLRPGAPGAGRGDQRPGRHQVPAPRPHGACSAACSTHSTRDTAPASFRQLLPPGPSAWHLRHGLFAHLRGRRHKEVWARGVVACWACARWAPGLVCRFPECGHPHVFPASSQVDENVARELVCHRMLRHNNVVLFKEARPFGHRALCQSRSLLAR